MSTIFRIDKEDLDECGILEFIHNHEESHLYWSSDWSPEFYNRLAYEGLISITHPLEDGSSVLLPEMQRSYAVLDWKNLHLSRHVRKLLPLVKSGVYSLHINSDFEQVLTRIMTYHNPCWLTKEYADILRFLNRSDNSFCCKVVSTELYNSEGTLLAGELGYRIGSIYTSLSGFIDRDNGPAGIGTLQMVLLARLLQEEGFAFWNLGHPNMEYKNRLGADNMIRLQFLQRWKQYRDTLPESLNIFQ